MNNRFFTGLGWGTLIAVILWLIIASLLFGCIPRSPGPPIVCRIPVPHAEYSSLRQERAQLDAANNLLQFCMAQWEGGVDRRTFP